MQNMNELRSVLAGTIDKLIAGEIDHKTAKEINNACGKMINSTKVQLDQNAFIGDTRPINFLLEVDEDSASE